MRPFAIRWTTGHRHSIDARFWTTWVFLSNIFRIWCQQVQSTCRALKRKGHCEKCVIKCRWYREENRGNETVKHVWSRCTARLNECREDVVKQRKWNKRKAHCTILLWHFLFSYISFSSLPNSFDESAHQSSTYPSLSPSFEYFSILLVASMYFHARSYLQSIDLSFSEAYMLSDGSIPEPNVIRKTLSLKMIRNTSIT